MYTDWLMFVQLYIRFGRNLLVECMAAILTIILPILAKLISVHIIIFCIFCKINKIGCETDYHKNDSEGIRN